MEYIIFNRNFFILKYSRKANYFAEAEIQLNVGQDIRKYYPEINGLEDSILDLLLDCQRISFKLEKINRKIHDRYIFFDLIFVRPLQQNIKESDFIMLIEDRTTTMLYFKKINQLTNENSLAIEQNITLGKQIETQKQQSYKRDRLLKLITQQINQSLNLTAIMHTAAQEIKNLLNCDRVLIYQCCPSQDDKIILEVVTERQYSLIEQNSYQRFVSCYVQSNKNREIHSIEDTHKAHQLEPVYQAQLLEFNIRARLILPLWQSGKFWGLIIIHQLHQPRKWQQWELDILQELREQLALAIKQAELYRQLETFATIDELTGLANRYCLNQCLENEWHRMARQKQPLAVIVADIDCFKAYNDYYSYLAGDNCLKTIANILIEVVKRPADLVARYGGEKFIILLPNTNLLGAKHLAYIIRDRLQQTQIPHQKSDVCPHLSLSIGIACQIPQINSGSQELIQQAEQALYRAKQRGRNLICH